MLAFKNGSLGCAAPWPPPYVCSSEPLVDKDRSQVIRVNKHLLEPQPTLGIGFKLDSDIGEDAHALLGSGEHEPEHHGYAHRGGHENDGSVGIFSHECICNKNKEGSTACNPCGVAAWGSNRLPDHSPCAMTARTRDLASPDGHASNQARSHR